MMGKWESGKRAMNDYFFSHRFRDDWTFSVLAI